jgi:hypothetical protein
MLLSALWGEVPVAIGEGGEEGPKEGAIATGDEKVAAGGAGGAGGAAAGAAARVDCDESILGDEFCIATKVAESDDIVALALGAVTLEAAGGGSGSFDERDVKAEKDEKM